MTTLQKVLENVIIQGPTISEEMKKSRNSITFWRIVKSYYNNDIERLSTKQLFLAMWMKYLNKNPQIKFTQKWQTLFETIDKILRVLYENRYPAIKTLSALMRKPIKDNEIFYKKSVELFGITQDEVKQIQEDYIDKVRNRNNNRDTLIPLYVCQIIDGIFKLGNSTNIYDNILAVMLATASRPVEVLSLSDYEKIPYQQHTIKIIGIAKNPNEVILIRNLVGLNARQVLLLLGRIDNNDQFSLIDATPTQINNEIATPLNERFKLWIKPILESNISKEYAQSEDFKNQLKQMTAYSCRAISVNTSYEIYEKNKPAPHQLYEDYVQTQLGHTTGQSSKSYLNVNILINKPITKLRKPKK